MGKYFIHILVAYLLVTGLAVPTAAISAEKERSPFDRFSIGIEAGAWKPNDLTSKPVLVPVGVDDATIFSRLIFNTPRLADWNLRFSVGFWGQRGIDDLPEIGSVSIFMLMLDLKERIIPDLRLTPFVSYGVSVFWGAEYPEQRDFKLFETAGEVGYGVNVGAGFDFILFPSLVLTTEFSYHYVRFNRIIGYSDDYSGPKVQAGFYLAL